MKKPSITRGEWEVKENGMWHEDNECYIGVDLNTEGDGLIVFERIEYKTDEDKANAKAISAVPDMIDALVELYEWHTSLKAGNHSMSEIQKWMMRTPHPNKALQALKKAGCTE